MQYRSFTRDKLQVSALGFGCMRLPLLQSGKPSYRESIRILQYGIDHGINYIDTAVPYHNGESEVIVGKALQNGYREKVLLATKFPTWAAEKKSDLDKILNEQLTKLQTDCIDVYLLHCLQKSYWGIVQKLEMYDWLITKRKQGKIRYLAFSFHDEFALFREIVDAYDWDVCQIQYNYVNENVQAGTAGLQYAAQKGLAVVIMEPLFGGTLANPVGKLGEVWKKSKQNPVDLALRWLWDKPEISLVLSGMSNMEQTVQNVEIAEKSGVGTLTDVEKSVIAEAQKIYDETLPIKCTKCKYCVPCPFEVDIPYNFELYNNMIAIPGNNNPKTLAKNLYAMLDREHRAGNCKDCGQCEQKCPQHLSIRKNLKLITETFN
ncbi:MAG: aldo/keto reductase [Planctomycetaceae bacterium]|nr:aldo/keto reductase [Planctomycetaceae bacterium]